MWYICKCQDIVPRRRPYVHDTTVEPAKKKATSDNQPPTLQGPSYEEPFVLTRTKSNLRQQATCPDRPLSLCKAAACPGRPHCNTYCK